jgi:hypothetical protein
MADDVVYVDENNNVVPAPRGSSSGTSYPPIAQKTEKADLLDKIKPDLIVELIRHKLMGEIEVNGKWIANPTLKNRALSEVGAWDLASLMLSASSQNVSLSKLNDIEIRNRALSIAITAQKMCLKNWKEYGITGIDQFYFVHEIIFTNTFITLKQSQDGGIRRLLSDTTQETRQVNIQENPRKFFRPRLR